MSCVASEASEVTRNIFIGRNLSFLSVRFIMSIHGFDVIMKKREKSSVKGGTRIYQGQFETIAVLTVILARILTNCEHLC